jgi:hypothetical protein
MWSHSFLAWTIFLFSLEADWAAMFQCDLCGPRPYLIICDGTSLVCRADLFGPDGPRPIEPTYDTGRYRFGRARKKRESKRGQPE